MLPPRQPKVPEEFPVGTPVKIVENYYCLSGDNLKGRTYYVKSSAFALGEWRYRLCNLSGGGGHNIAGVPERVLMERFGDHIEPFTGHNHFW